MEAIDYKQLVDSLGRILLFTAFVLLTRYFFGSRIDKFKKENPTVNSIVVIVSIVLFALGMYYSCHKKETPLNTQKLHTHPEKVHGLDQILFSSEFITLAPSNDQRV